MARKLI
ncbi:uncharacterized protein FFE2_16049 [Fusarium fujikuroi]|nr:uncharacterized protein FFE2_16049 [Fusarium fujikuroi]SCV30717.1 uncharacterized protein FFFS_02422 [Fusarium fujikuroi]